MQGYVILGQALAAQKLQNAYGIVGVPVIQLGYAIQAAGIKYYGFRNEQQASYTAGYTGYLTGKPGICLCVSGPGHVNALAGVMNAWANNWPMILISGSNDLNQTSRQAFQEVDQVYMVKPFTKYSVRITRVEDIPYHVNKAVKMALSGRPGPVYLDLPGDVLTDVGREDIKYLPFEAPGKFIPINEEFAKAIEMLKDSKKPLIIVGKGAAYQRAQNQIRQLVDKTNIPFLPTPMGKGVVPDSHPLNISAARSTALKQADLVILIGARFNWILHFGLPPRFRKDMKLIQLDISPEEIGHNVQAGSKLIGNIKQTVKILNQRLDNFKMNSPDWIKLLAEKCQKNTKLNLKLMSQKTVPLTYYNSMGTIKEYLPQNVILIGEGANTMDIGRTVFTHQNPRTKLDAATFGTMGIGTAALIAARSTNPDKWAVSVMGDSAFGFSAMECQTLTRYQLGSVIFIINNNGIYAGIDELEGDPMGYAVTSLNPSTRYEKMAKAFGGKGYSARTLQQLRSISKSIFVPQNINKLFIVNVHIQAASTKKPQENEWLTRQAPKPKL